MKTSINSTIHCQAELIKKLNFLRYKRCTNKATCKHDGKYYCGIHDPERKKKRQEKLELKKQKTINLKAKLNIAYLFLKQNHSK